MKSSRTAALILPVAMLVFVAIACSFPTLSAEVAVTQTLEALATEAAATLAAVGAQIDEGGEATEAPADEAAGSPEETPEPTATIAHQVYPANPGSASSWMTDRSSAALAGEGRAIGDNYDLYLLERPFTSQAMEYRGYLDINRGEIDVSSPWVYITIFLEGSPPSDTEVAYGVEIDLDLDGRGDWFITGLVPPDSEWTTDFVRACTDSNNDVGGARPIRADSPSGGLNGYDDCVFDSGIGSDPDTAWIRRDPSSSSRVQLAFKHSLIGLDSEFLWGPWSDEGVQDVGKKDYNDAFTIADAGSPASESQYYPLASLALVDNTCRWTYDFTPTENYLGMCPLPATPTPTPQLGSISGYVYRGTSSSPSNPRFSGVTVQLGQGSCPSTGYKSTTTGGDGSYTFSGVPAGSYCVTVNSSGLPPASYGWGSMSPSFPSQSCPPFNPYQGVNLGDGENKGGVNFAFLEIVG